MSVQTACILHSILNFSAGVRVFINGDSQDRTRKTCSLSTCTVRKSSSLALFRYSFALVTCFCPYDERAATSTVLNVSSICPTNGVRMTSWWRILCIALHTYTMIIINGIHNVAANMHLAGNTIVWTIRVHLNNGSIVHCRLPRVKQAYVRGQVLYLQYISRPLSSLLCPRHCH